MAITILVGVMQVGGSHWNNSLCIAYIGYALTPGMFINASSYTSHLTWYKPFWSPLGIQDSTDQNQGRHLSMTSGYLHIADGLAV